MCYPFGACLAGQGMQRSHFAVVCSLGALLGLFIGFVVFSIAHGGGTGAVFAFWIQRPGLFWPWPMFGAAIAGLSLYAVWIFHRPRKPVGKSRTDVYYADRQGRRKTTTQGSSKSISSLWTSVQRTR